MKALYNSGKVRTLHARRRYDDVSYMDWSPSFSKARRTLQGEWRPLSEVVDPIPLRIREALS